MTEEEVDVKIQKPSKFHMITIFMMLIGVMIGFVLGANYVVVEDNNVLIERIKSCEGMIEKAVQGGCYIEYESQKTYVQNYINPEFK